MNLSRIVAGCWRMHSWGWTAPQRLAWIESCVELGVSSFDHADIYGDYTVEGLFGDALALKPGMRQHMQLVSKCGIQLVSSKRPLHRVKAYDTSAAHIAHSVENSLRALRTDYLDGLLLHRPDPLMDADEVAEVFHRLQKAGKVHWFGVSNFTPAQFALLHSRVVLATNQVECSPLSLTTLHDGTLDQAQQLRTEPMIWSPLAGGRLFTSDEPAAQRVRTEMAKIAPRFEVSMATLAYAWLLKLPSLVHPIVGSSRIAAMKEALAAQAINLDAASWHAIWAAGAGHEVA